MQTFGSAIDHPRLRWIALNSTDTAIDDGTDVLKGLQQTPKTLPCRYFYDNKGSELFEQICNLPEYYPTRTEQAILESCVKELVEFTGVCELVELGSGSSRKTRILLEAYNQFTPSLRYCPIDVSAGILRTTALDLLRQYPTLKLCSLAGTYEKALLSLPPVELENRLLIFLGSTIGNLNASECDVFLTQIQNALKPGEFFLLGVDLQKPIEHLEAAYNDAQGVTAAFNLNLLQHLNDRFDANFDLSQFEHWAFYNKNDHQIEMHLRSLRSQSIALKTLDYTVSLQKGETIRTEISRKFHLPTLTENLKQHAFQPLKIWTDPNQWFGLLLCQRQCLTEDCP